VGGAADVLIEAETLLVEHLGGEILAHMKLSDGSGLDLKTPGHHNVHRGERVQIGIRAAYCYLFTEDGLSLPALGPRQLPN
jgi:hypothetical protein